MAVSPLRVLEAGRSGAFQRLPIVLVATASASVPVAGHPSWMAAGRRVAHQPWVLEAAVDGAWVAKSGPRSSRPCDDRPDAPPRGPDTADGRRRRSGVPVGA